MASAACQLPDGYCVFCLPGSPTQKPPEGGTSVRTKQASELLDRRQKHPCLPFHLENEGCFGWGWPPHCGVSTTLPAAAHWVPKTPAHCRHRRRPGYTNAPLRNCDPAASVSAVLGPSYPHARDPHHVRKEGFCVGSLQEEELRNVHDVALGEAQLPL